jgi:hypothetical protein
MQDCASVSKPGVGRIQSDHPLAHVLRKRQRQLKSERQLSKKLTNHGVRGEASPKDDNRRVDRVIHVPE